MRRWLSLFLGLSLVLALVVTVRADSNTVTVKDNDEYGNILTDSKGMTLYKFDPDKPNVSVCYDACEQAWPPLIVKSGQPTASSDVTAKLGLTTRKDGNKQVTANGIPLYYFAGDKQPGDTNGQGLKGVWWVLSPSAQPIKSEDNTPAQTPSTGGGGMAGHNSVPAAPLAGAAVLGLAVLGLAYRARHWAR